MPSKYKYYKVVGTTDDLFDITLFSSYNEDDCDDEIIAESDQWYDEGFHNIRIEFEVTQTPPDPEVYGQDFRGDFYP